MIEYAEFSTLLLTILLLIGLAGLSFGGDWLCQGAASLALNLKINPIIVGLTVVSIATSMPEMVAAMIASAKGDSGIAMGNIMGSNIGNIGLILGISAIVYPMGVQARLITKEVPILLGVTVLFTLLSLFAVLRDGTLAWVEGIILLILAAGYLYYVTRHAQSKHDLDPLEQEITEELSNPIESNWLAAGLVALGTILLAIGAEMLVGSASVLAERQNVSHELIGLTVVAIGTSLPELAAAIAAARRKQGDLIAGNVVGSNLFNIMLIAGATTTAFPIKVEASMFNVMFPAMMLFTFLLWIVFLTNRKVSRLEGFFLVILYTLVIILAYLTDTQVIV